MDITLGVGTRNAYGLTTAVPCGDVPLIKALAMALEGADASRESWWSPHVWRDGHRGTDRWLGAGCVAIDVDYHDANGEHALAPAEAAAHLSNCALRGCLPGSLFHLTPRGARVVFVFDRVVEDPDQMIELADRYAASVADALEASGVPPGYRVDGRVHRDLARLLYTPSATVERARRTARVLAMRDKTYAVSW